VCWDNCSKTSELEKAHKGIKGALSISSFQQVLRFPQKKELHRKPQDVVEIMAGHQLHHSQRHAVKIPTPSLEPPRSLQDLLQHWIGRS
jgi:hypothetical protein